MVPDERAAVAKLGELHARYAVSATGHVAAVTIDSSSGKSPADLDLNFLSALSGLEKLEVFQVPARPEALQGLSQVERLDVLAVPGPWRADEHLAVIAKIPNLREVTFGTSNVSSAGIAQLAGMHDLENLAMHGGITDKSLSAISPAKKLTTLVLDRTSLTPAGLKAIEGLVNLEVLQFPARCGTDAGLEHLQKLVKLRHLGKIARPRVPGTLADPGITDRGVACLRNMTELEELDLGCEELTDDALRSLQALTKLQSLDVSRTKIGDDGLKFLQGMTKLQSLNLWETGVSGTGLKYLQGMKELRSLRLGNNDAIADPPSKTCRR